MSISYRIFINSVNAFCAGHGRHQGYCQKQRKESCPEGAGPNGRLTISQLERVTDGDECCAEE